MTGPPRSAPSAPAIGARTGHRGGTAGYWPPSIAACAAASRAIGFFHRAGLDYVSCSPFRVPIARLAAAQAAINNE